MNKYRIRTKDGLYYIQKRFLFIFWSNIHEYIDGNLDLGTLKFTTFLKAQNYVKKILNTRT